MKTFPDEDEPDSNVLAPHHLYLGLILTWYGFMFVWPVYPATGAFSVLVGLLIAADDAISHAFGVWTPIDWAYKQIRHLVPK